MIIFTTLASLALPLSTALNPEWWWPIALYFEEEPEGSLEDSLRRIDDLLTRIVAGNDSPHGERVPLDPQHDEDWSIPYEEEPEYFPWQYDDCPDDHDGDGHFHLDGDLGPLPSYFFEGANDDFTWVLGTYEVDDNWIPESPEPWWKGAVRDRRHWHQ